MPTASTIQASSSHASTSVGERIAQFRKRLGLSQSAIATAANISREAIGKYERGKSSPSIDVAGRIAGALGTSLDYLVSGTTSPTQQLDTDILARAQQLAELPAEERAPLLRVLDAYLRDFHTAKAYAP